MLVSQVKKSIHWNTGLRHFDKLRFLLEGGIFILRILTDQINTISAEHISFYILHKNIIARNISLILVSSNLNIMINNIQKFLPFPVHFS